MNMFKLQISFWQYILVELLILHVQCTQGGDDGQFDSFTWVGLDLLQFMCYNNLPNTATDSAKFPYVQTKLEQTAK